MTTAAIETVEHGAGHDEWFLALVNRCWGYVPLTASTWFFVRGEGDHPIAAAEAGPLASHPEWCLFFGDSVHPDHRRKGLHALLIAERIEYARGIGCRRCVATTYGPNTTSARNYERAGFRREAWIPDGPAEHQTEWVRDL
jgi:GNAT superfamily N-acetyltransferase